MSPAQVLAHARSTARLGEPRLFNIEQTCIEQSRRVRQSRSRTVSSDE